MATKSYRLKMGHNTTFRRTIDPSADKPEKKKDGEAYQLVFEPGQDYELSDEEAAGLEKEISTGLLVPTDKDEHGRQRVKPQRPEHQTPVKKSPAGDVEETEVIGGTPGGRKSKGPNVGAKVVSPAAAKKAAGAAKKASAKKK